MNWQQLSLSFPYHEAARPWISEIHEVSEFHRRNRSFQISLRTPKVSAGEKTFDMSDIPMLGLNCRYLLSIRNSGNALTTGIFYHYRGL